MVKGSCKTEDGGFEASRLRLTAVTSSGRKRSSSLGSFLLIIDQIFDFIGGNQTFYLNFDHSSDFSAPVFRKYPVQDLRCPRGLQEAPFLDLLRSRFPQLASGAPFDLFVTDNSRRLRALQVPALTPEQIHRTIRSGGNSALYIRLRVGGTAGSEDLPAPPCF